MARMVATKAALSIRVDALADDDTKSTEGAPIIGVENRAKLESRLRALEHRLGIVSVRSSAAEGSKQSRYESNGNGATYNESADAPAGLIPTQPEEKKVKKEKRKSEAAAADMDVDAEDEGVSKEERKRLKKEAKKAAAAAAGGDADEQKSEKKSKKRRASEAAGEEPAPTEGEKPKKSKKSKKSAE